MNPPSLPRIRATITCPRCAHPRTEQMPTDACVFFYRCTACGEILQPRAGDCCVFCSYADVACPPVQAGACCDGPPAQPGKDIAR